MRRHGFSLVELSIVLVILGLLIGGVLSGQSLIRAAELRSVTTEYNRYVTAVQSFRDKYFALPGDMNNAAAFWGAADGSTGNTAACVTTASTSTATCNGDGNGIVSPSSGSNEYYRFWQHLANAGLIEGQYNGITQGSTTYSSTAANSPRGKIPNTLWMAVNYGSAISGNANYFNADYGNHFEYGGMAPNTGPNGGVMGPDELWNIDTKIDDGKPAMGRLMVLAPLGLSSCTTTTANNPATVAADYLLIATGKICAAVFSRAF